MHDNGKFAKHVFYDVRGTVADAAPVVRIGEPLFCNGSFLASSGKEQKR